MNLCVRWMLLSVLLVGFVHAQESKPNQLSEQELAEGWILLFDGETTFGWNASSEANWAVKDGIISVSQGTKGLLYTTTQFADYELKLQFRSAEDTNSGVFLRTIPNVTNPSEDCYELNIAPPSNPFPTGSFVGREAYKDARPTDQWQTYHVRAKGNHFQVSLNGQQILDYKDKHPLPTGHIGLQLNSGKVQFRDIKLKPLGLESIFTGKDLSGWKLYPEKKSVYSVTEEGYLNVKDGPGQLETTGKWGNFVFQLEVIANGKHLNSGIFFRSIPGDFWMGYESQIHNGFKDADRTAPLDYGSGGIYRRQKARKVMADDFQWFSKTIVADGPHLAVWVNGVQVTDWTDTRKPDENPRRGLRTAPGTISIQGHDPTTDLSFRKLQIVETPTPRE